MIKDDKFKAKLREAVLDFLKEESRVPTQGELGIFYDIKPHNLDYFKMSRGYKSMQEFLEECVGSEVLGKCQVPFENELRQTLLKHMKKHGCLPFGREYGELYRVSYGNLRYIQLNIEY